MEDKIIITIGREYGCGGRSVAEAAGRMLGIPVYDNDLLTQAAADNGFSMDMFKKRDEKRHLFSLSALFSSPQSNTTNYLSDNALFQMQSETIKSIAAKGSCIIVGRCADYILRGEPDILKVFLTAPLEERIRRTMDRIGVDEETARKIIARKERNRINYYNGYTLGKWGYASTYDLCLNTSLLGIEGSAEVIVDFARKIIEKKTK